ncbi:MAG: MFS transporter [Calditrichaeota bacterium]|nr:MFS transporter [Calditrichota bacterium]
MKDHKKELIIIFLVIFIDLLGFGLIIPIIPYYLEEFVTQPDQIGKTVATMIMVYSLMQFIFSPIWGRLSDRIGRRPVLLISLLGSAATHVMFALGGNLIVLFIARILTGISAATVPTAMAYISDITSPEERAKGMGLVGAAFGLGFILGPAIGGVLSHFAGYRVPLLLAGFLSLTAFAFAYFKLKETLDVKNLVKKDYSPFNLKKLYRAVTHPNLGILFLIFFIVSMSFANFETIFALYLEHNFGLRSDQAGYFFAMIGVISATTQGLFIGKLARKFGEKRLITTATMLLGSAFIIFPFVQALSFFILIVAVIAFGFGMHNPSVASLISKNASADEQGGVLGINQSFSSLGRVIGPIWAGFFFDRFGPGIPFVSAGILILIAMLLSLRLYGKPLKESHRIEKVPLDSTTDGV